MAEQLKSSWIWHDDMTDMVNGATVDYDRGTIQWYEQPGCACGDSKDEQKLEDFIKRGPALLAPPDDIIAEMQKTFQDFLEIQ
ncbi:hypothetical protein MASR2M15_08830 [Anaerolineales bacterium]